MNATGLKMRATRRRRGRCDTAFSRKFLFQPKVEEFLINPAFITDSIMRTTYFILGPKRIQLLGGKDHKWGKDLTSSTPGMKITAGHQPKFVHIARLAVHFALRSDITSGREMCVRLQ